MQILHKRRITTVSESDKIFYASQLEIIECLNNDK